ncbi:MAG: L,D-transpeptidase family protein [Gammaproteobacteria bacterium]|nr:L,D-transpeptidase family protein [Gammaproteobacteria bacterium]
MQRLLLSCFSLIISFTLLLTPAYSAANPSIEKIVNSGKNLIMYWPDFSDYKGQVSAFYSQNNFKPAWFRNGKPTKAAGDVIRVLRDAGAKGLNPLDYDSKLLTNALKNGTSGKTNQVDVALTVGVMRYVSDLRIGRVDFKSLSNDFDIPDKRINLPLFVKDLTKSSHVRQQLDSVEPQLPQYKVLPKALAKYRNLAKDPRLSEKLSDSKTIHPGEPYAQTNLLAYKLHKLGDLKNMPSSNSYSGAVVNGVKNFQKRHGIDEDGVLGKGTFRQLNTPMKKRVDQITLAMERFRWFPNDFGQNPVIVNLPEFRARAYRKVGNQKYQLKLEMNVVVGKAYPRNQTPVFNKRMNHLVLAPYWNVPTSITKGELIPKLDKDPSYLRKKHYEIVDGEGNSHPYNSSSKRGLLNGSLRIRQKPGNHNSLGLVKFMFPNKYSVYMHGTPAQSLFAKSKRDYSHGCIRLEEPLKMAEYITQLDGQGSTWTKARLKKTMESGKATTVKLNSDIQVFVLYTTVVVHQDGKIFFYDDVYGHDKKLAHALAGGYPYPWVK